eukprot:TRINITY_DN5879_c0_g1_i2.p1 TRINITY_DN5879_c0_g1~~TRINITY_DN5879_c0_g1_i2.p1  ORF type:complete len:410 (-),score=-35.39 TRINITY_DN5879_c0_g1_i2:146-1201(-)
MLKRNRASVVKTCQKHQIKQGSFVSFDHMFMGTDKQQQNEPTNFIANQLLVQTISQSTTKSFQLNSTHIYLSTEKKNKSKYLLQTVLFFKVSYALVIQINLNISSSLQSEKHTNFKQTINSHKKHYKTQKSINYYHLINQSIYLQRKTLFFQVYHTFSHYKKIYLQQNEKRLLLIHKLLVNRQLGTKFLKDSRVKVSRNVLSITQKNMIEHVANQDELSQYTNALGIELIGRSILYTQTASNFKHLPGLTYVSSLRGTYDNNSTSQLFVHAIKDANNSCIVLYPQLQVQCEINYQIFCTVVFLLLIVYHIWTILTASILYVSQLLFRVISFIFLAELTTLAMCVLGFRIAM